MKMVQNYEQLLNQYAVEVVPLEEEDGGGYMAVFPQLGRTLVGYGETRTEALADLLDSVPLLVESLKEHGDQLPEPEVRPAWRDYSGRVTLRIPKMLHAQLDRLAAREGVSLNALLNSILQAGATAMLAGKQFGAIDDSSALEQPLEAFEEVLPLDRSLAERAKRLRPGLPELEIIHTEVA